MSTVNSDHVAHHFDNMEQQFSAAKLGVWLFLCTEILMFGGLFVVYAVYHNLYPEMFAEGAKFLDWRLGAVNTVVLLISSYTMAMGIYFAQKNDNKSCAKMMIVTLVCAATFMVIKYFEYTHKFHLGIYPGELFAFEGAQVDNLALYFSLYFLMTGLHGSHVLVGMGLIFWIWRRASKGEFSENYYTPVEGVGLFWHLVDLIWIYLFPLLYLVG